MMIPLVPPFSSQRRAGGRAIGQGRGNVKTHSATRVGRAADRRGCGAAALYAQENVAVLLPLAADPARKLRIRCVTRPDPAQAALLGRTGLRLPEPLRPPPPLTEM
jgi:streptomycin 6-kinase